MPLGRLQEEWGRCHLPVPLCGQHPPRSPHVLLGWELRGGLQLGGSDPGSLEQFDGGLLQALVNEVAARIQAQGGDSCAGLEPPLPQRTRSRLLGKMLLLFQADNGPFPCKSLHAAVQTYPRSISAQQMLRLKGQTYRPALLFAKRKQKLFAPEGGNSVCRSSALGPVGSWYAGEWTFAVGLEVA